MAKPWERDWSAVPSGSRPEVSVPSVAPWEKYALVDQPPQERGWDNWWDRFEYGLGDIPHGAMQLLLETFGTDKGKQVIRNVMQKRAGGYGEVAPEGFDWARLAGNVTAAAPAALIPGAATAPGAAAIGAGTAALMPVEGDPKDFFGEKLFQTGTGAFGGVLGQKVAGGLSRMISPKAGARTQALREAGVTPTPGQTLGGAAARTESALTSVPVLGGVIKGAQQKAVNELNRAVINRTLAPIGQKGSGKIGREGFEEVANTLSDAYDDLLPRLTFRADQELMNDLNMIAQFVRQFPDEQVKHFEKLLRQNLKKNFPSGTASGETFKKVQSELSRHARNMSGNSDGYVREVGRALYDVNAALRRSLERANPDLAPELSAINNAYANFTILRDAVTRTGSEEGVFSPMALRQAVRRADRSVGKGAYGKGQARLQDLSDPAVSVLGPKYPDSGTAGRLMLPGLLGAAYVEPTAALAGTAATLPFLPGGRQAALGLLARRPGFAGPVQRGVNRFTPLAGPAGAQVPLALQK